MNEEKEIVFGVYFHPKKGFAIAESSNGPNEEWQIDKNKKKLHPFFRFDVPVLQVGAGNYFFYKLLKDYEYIGEI